MGGQPALSGFGDRPDLFSRRLGQGNDLRKRLLRRIGKLRALLHRSGGFLHACHAFSGTLLDGVHGRTDFLRGAPGFLGQATHLVGDNGKPLARFAGPRCFDCRVQGQQVGLVGDAGDNAHDPD